MLPSVLANERKLNHELLSQPAAFEYRYDHAADCHLRRVLFRSLAAQRDEYLSLFFPAGGPPPDQSKPWSLREAQGAVEGAEYSAAAKGTACGHIFKNGESSYTCRTCAADDTCVLCARCFDSSDHEGHMVLIQVSPGNSGCCDCGDPEAWKREVHCSIHTAGIEDAGHPARGNGKNKQKAAADEPARLPEELVQSISMTVSRCVDYLCDVFSCAPEQMRLPKTEATILQDEADSRLTGPVYGEEPLEQETEYALILWNDEKHTIDEVRDQVARACSQSRRFGFEKAGEVDNIGRSIVQYSTDLEALLEMARIIEQIKVTVTIRSSRDTFREQMCATIIDWIADIAGCAVGPEAQLLRRVVCEELLRPWRPGSLAVNKLVGEAGIFDHEFEEEERRQRERARYWNPLLRMRRNPQQFAAAVQAELANNDDDDDDEDDENEDGENNEDEEEDDGAPGTMPMDVDDDGEGDRTPVMAAIDGNDMEIDIIDVLDDEDAAADVAAMISTVAAAARRESQQQQQQQQQQQGEPGTPAGQQGSADSDDGGGEGDETPRARTTNAPFANVPATPNVKVTTKFRPSKHWLEKPAGFRATHTKEPYEDIWQRVRLDFLVLYDLRMWKTLRISLRHLYITTVVTIPNFKAVLGLRFAGLYTALAQLYLIADREPDHSIINLSLQILTTPTITADVVERANFMTNLMAILYTFLTTRQVGFPEDVNPRATLAFEAGTVTNRRMFHFLADLRYMFQSSFIHRKIREEPRYLLQFLDLVKLHQGVCPNVRATGEHVEYESEAWIGASMIVQHINKLCKQVAASFEPGRYRDDADEITKRNASRTSGPFDMNDSADLQRAIRTVAQVILINSFGYERKRFVNAELKDDLSWHTIGPFAKDGLAAETVYLVPKHVVQSEPMSFHHPLHYLFSWLLEDAKALDRKDLRALLQFSVGDLRDPWNSSSSSARMAITQFPTGLSSDELLSAIFDSPIRVCSWLAQMKAGMWVRNGITLRHQAHQYRSVTQRDVGFQRDIFLLQAGLVLCGSDTERVGERFLAQVIDRFQMVAWFSGHYDVVPGFEDAQQLDVVEDFLHLLVIVLSERGNLKADLDERAQHDRILQHDIAHALCFKPLSFSEIGSRVTEKVGESDDFNRVLDGMTTYRAPEGLSDTGTFELKPEYIKLVDPYYAHYTRNQREEAEAIYKKYVAGQEGKKAENVVYEPNLEPISSGLFKDLSAFTRTPLFAQVIAAALNFAINAKDVAEKIQPTRIETFLHLVLHLTGIAIAEDKSRSGDTFVHFATWSGQGAPSVAELLVKITTFDEYASCHPTVLHLLRKMQLQEGGLSKFLPSLGAILDRADAPSPSALSAEDKERKKQEAKARQAKIMQQMKQQQANFLQNQGLAGFEGEDDADDDDEMDGDQSPEIVEARKTWAFPSGTCILCQEETDDQRLYGTFDFIGESTILRSTPVHDEDFIREVIKTPASLDRSAEDIRPFGVSGENRKEVLKVASDGALSYFERQELSKGFPHRHSVKGPVATSCGHMMHFSCFEVYAAATLRRHQMHISRNHPERSSEFQEFVCPLCKALGNTFLPIIWKSKECAHEHELHAAPNFSDWLAEQNCADMTFLIEAGGPSPNPILEKTRDADVARAQQYVSKMFSPSLVQNMQDLKIETPSAAQARLTAATAARVSHPWHVFLTGGAAASTPPPPPVEETTMEQSRIKDLWNAYDRIDKTIAHNLKSIRKNAASTNPLPELCKSLGMSISAFEIANRGVGSNPMATSIITDMPEQAITHLRILSETIESYLAAHVLRPDSSNEAAADVMLERELMRAHLFGVDEHGSQIPSFGPALFENDIFLFLSDWLSLNSPDVAEASMVLHLCYWAEIVKTIFVCKRIAKHLDTSSSTYAPIMKSQEGRQREQFRLALIGMDFEDNRFAHISWTNSQVSLLYLLVEKYALAFLRKSIVLMYIRYGLDFVCPFQLDPDAAELERLTKLLHLPTINELCELYTNHHSEGGEQLRNVTSTWLSQATSLAGHQTLDKATITVPHPAIFELVGLPKNYDMLTEEAARRRCPTTGRELTDPAVCLTCGEIFCSQAACCTKDRNKGGVFQHLTKHGETVGVFINIRKCSVLFAHGPGAGGFHQAPYLDKHGEPDPTLRRHHQLFLNQRRYDKLFREVWLQHQIPTIIARKLEGDTNPGGWETL